MVKISGGGTSISTWSLEDIFETVGVLEETRGVTQVKRQVNTAQGRQDPRKYRTRPVVRALESEENAYPPEPE